MELELWKDTDKLNLIWDEEGEGQEYIEYQLYESNFLTLMRYIFRNVLERKKSYVGKEFNESQHDRSNIFPFMGRRGSGKTTAMKEFCRILKTMDDKKTKKWWIEHALDSEDEKRQLQDQNFGFHVLKLIDASLLEDREDLLELILAGIYKEYQPELEQNGYFTTEGDRTRKVMRRFEELLQMYRTVRGVKDADDSSVVSMIRFQRSSNEISESIGELLDELVDLKKSASDHEFFVIAIDDLDLNIRHGYEMLEQLQKFFAYYRVIILISVDYEQMLRVCVEHFHKDIKYTDKQDRKLKDEPHSQRLANDYMTKVFPLQQRLFMPDMRKEVKGIKIGLTEQDKVTVKKFMMSKVADRMRIFYDATGGKKHFCEPNTVRELVDYNSFLNSLTPVDFDKLKWSRGLSDRNAAKDEIEKQLHIYDQNHERFNWDITKRLAQTTLTMGQQRTFNKLLEFRLERRAMYFQKVEKEHETGLIRIMDVKVSEREEYTYGSLLQKIYEWGRNYYEDKPFISCVIASFTSEMVREYIGYCYCLDEDKRERHKKRLYQFMGSSFCNKWSGGIFPKVAIKTNNEDLEVNGGYIATGELKNVDIRIGMDALKKLAESDLSEIEKEKILQEWFLEEKTVEILECIDMFCVKRKGESDYAGIKFEFDADQNSIVIKGAQREKCSIDIMGFVIKSLDYKSQIQALHLDIKNGLVKSINKCLENRVDGTWLKENTEKMIKEHSIFTQHKAEQFEYEVAFPFYDLDLAYNVLKRIKNKVSDVIKADEWYDNVLSLYQRIEDGLEEQAKEYCVPMEYAEIFRECPYIQAIRAFKDMPLMRGRIQDSIIGLLTTIEDPVQPSDQQEGKKSEKN